MQSTNLHTAKACVCACPLFPKFLASGSESEMPACPRSRALVVSEYTLAVANEPFLAISGEGRMNWPTPSLPSTSPFLVLNSVNKVRPQTARRQRQGPPAPRLPHTCKQITIRHCEAILVGEMPLQSISNRPKCGAAETNSI